MTLDRRRKCGSIQYKVVHIINGFKMKESASDLRVKGTNRYHKEELRNNLS